MVGFGASCLNLTAHQHIETVVAVNCSQWESEHTHTHTHTERERERERDSLG